MASFEFEIPGLSDVEEKVVTAFVDRLTEIAREEGGGLSLWGDGAPILVKFADEMLPDYTQDQKVEFVMKVMDNLNIALALNNEPPKGSG